MVKVKFEGREIEIRKEIFCMILQSAEAGTDLLVSGCASEVLVGMDEIKSLGLEPGGGKFMPGLEP